MLHKFQEEGVIEKEKRIERESIEAGDDGENRHTELWRLFVLCLDWIFLHAVAKLERCATKICDIW